jgi:hypothetical protein
LKDKKTRTVGEAKVKIAGKEVDAKPVKEDYPTEIKGQINKTISEMRGLTDALNKYFKKLEKEEKAKIKESKLWGDLISRKDKLLDAIKNAK